MSLMLARAGAMAAGAGGVAFASVEALRTDLTLSGVQAGQLTKTFGVDAPPTGVNVTSTLVTVTPSFADLYLTGWDFGGRALTVQASASVITENCLFESPGFGGAYFDFVDVYGGGSYGARYCTYRGHPAHPALTKAVKWRASSITLGITERNRYLEMPNDCYKPNSSEQIRWCYFGFLKHVPAGTVEWSSLTTYAAGDIALDGSGNVFMSLVDSNLDNALPAYDPGGSLTDFWRGLTPHGDNITVDVASNVAITSCLIDNTTEPPETVPDATAGEYNPLGLNNALRIKRNTPDSSPFGAVMIRNCATYRSALDTGSAAMEVADGGKAGFNGPIRFLNNWLSPGSGGDYVFTGPEIDEFSGNVDYTTGDPISITTRTLAPPVNTVAPAITGTAAVGEDLTVSNGTWTGQPIPAFTYQWTSDGEPIDGATASAFTITESELDTTVACTVTGANTQGAASAAAAGVEVVAVTTSFGAETVTGTPTATNAPASRQVAVIGDSRAGTQQSGSTGMEILSPVGHLLWHKLNWNFSVGGSTINHAVVTQAPAAVASGAKVFFVLTGTNGAGAGAGTELENRQAQTLALLAALDVVDGIIFLCNEIPGQTGAYPSGSPQDKIDHHAWINGLTTASASLVNAQLVIVNTWDAVADPATGLPLVEGKPGLTVSLREAETSDGLHPSTWGSERIAKAFFEAATAHFAGPCVDYASPDVVLLDGTTVDNIPAFGDFPDGWVKFGAANGLVMTTIGTGTGTVFTVENTSGGDLQIDVRRTLSAETTNAVLLVEYEIEPNPSASPTPGATALKSDPQITLVGTSGGGFDFGTGVNDAAETVYARRSNADSDQDRRFGGRRRTCLLVGATALSGTDQVRLVHRVPAGGRIVFHRVDLYER